MMFQKDKFFKIFIINIETLNYKNKQIRTL